LLVVGPRLNDLTGLQHIGHDIDMVGLSRAVVAMLAERLLREIDNNDPGRLIALSESARLWTNIGERWSSLEAEIPKPVKDSAMPADGTPLPFRFDALAGEAAD
jgi:hypothetical protein